MSRISADDVRKVAKLARLDLPEDKVATYTGQLESILEYVGQLERVDTEGVPETTRAVEVTNVTREDGVAPTPVREDILNQAPLREGDFFRAPKILAECQRLRGRRGWVLIAMRSTKPSQLRCNDRLGTQRAARRIFPRRFRWLRTPTRMS